MRTCSLWLVAAMLVYALCRMLFEIDPRATLRGLFAVSIPVGLSILAVRLIKSRRIGMRTLVFVLPLVLAILCIPAQFVAKNYTLRRSFANARIHTARLEPSGPLPAQLHRLADLAIGYPAGNHFDTQLSALILNVPEIDEQNLRHVKLEATLQRILVGLGTQRVTPELVDWLNARSPATRVSLSVGALRDEDAQQLQRLGPVDDVACFGAIERETLRVIMRNQLDALTLQNTTPSAAIANPPSAAQKADAIRIRNAKLPAVDLIRIVQLKDCRHLTLNQTLPFSVDEFSAIAALPRLEHLDLNLAWITTEHLMHFGSATQLRSLTVRSATAKIDEEQLKESLGSSCVLIVTP